MIRQQFAFGYRAERLPISLHNALLTSLRRQTARIGARRASRDTVSAELDDKAIWPLTAGRIALLWDGFYRE
jgi:hypothetical protein